MPALGGPPHSDDALAIEAVVFDLDGVIVDLTALARGAPGIAFGDAFGSSLVDSTLTVGVGGLVAPAEVTVGLAVTGAIYSLLAVAVVGAVLAARGRHDRWSGITFVGLYALAYAVLIVAA